MVEYAGGKVKVFGIQESKSHDILDLSTSAAEKIWRNFSVRKVE